MEEENQAFTRTTMPLLSKSLSHKNPESPSDAERFKQSLRELKDLRSQLYHAADYCENTFRQAEQKKILLKNTKNYLCEVIVTVVDHLGTVSSNLERRLNGSSRISQTEQSIDCLNQRLLTCQQYASSLELSSLPWSTRFPSHHQHYVSRGTMKNDQLIAASCETTFDAEIITDYPLVRLTSGGKLSTVLPVLGSPARFLRPSTSPFGSPAEDIFKLGSSEVKKKPLPRSNNILTFIRKSKKKDVGKYFRRLTL